MMIYKFRVPILPISINQVYRYNFHTRTKYLSEEARHFKGVLKIACPKMEFSCPLPRLNVWVEYYSPKWICKNGKYRKIDGSNYDKLVYDALSERLGIDDSHFWKWGGVKILSEEEYTEIMVEEIV